MSATLAGGDFLFFLKITTIFSCLIFFFFDFFDFFCLASPTQTTKKWGRSARRRSSTTPTRAPRWPSPARLTYVLCRCASRGARGGWVERRWVVARSSSQFSYDASGSAGQPGPLSKVTFGIGVEMTVGHTIYSTGVVARARRRRSENENEKNDHRKKKMWMCEWHHRCARASATVFLSCCHTGESTVAWTSFNAGYGPKERPGVAGRRQHRNLLNG